METLKDIIIFILSLLIIFPIAGVIWVSIHELGHAIASIIVGFKISSFTFGPFVYYWNGSRYVFKVSFATMKNYFGRVHPHICSIKSDKQFCALKYKIAFVGIGGPLLELAAFVVFLKLIGYVSNDVVRLCLIITVSGIFSISFAFFSEIIAVIKVLTDRRYTYFYAYAWSFYGNYDDFKAKSFIAKKINELGKSFEPFKEGSDIGNSYLTFLNIMLELYLSGYISSVPSNILNIMDMLFDKWNGLKFKSANEKNTYLSLLYRYLVYLAATGSNKEEIKMKYFELKKIQGSKISKEVLYEMKRAEHFIGIKDNLKFICSKNNLPSFFANDKGYYHINKLINTNIEIRSY